MNKLIQIAKIALLTIILAEEVRKATKKTKFIYVEGGYNFDNSKSITEKLLNKQSWIFYQVHASDNA